MLNKIEYRALEDERDVKKEWMKLQQEAEEAMKKRIIQDYFKNIYEPLDTAVPDTHQEYIRMIFRAVAELIQGEGDVNYV